MQAQLPGNRDKAKKTAKQSNLILLSLVISLVEILKHHIIIFNHPLIGEAEIAIIPDYDVIQHL